MKHSWKIVFAVFILTAIFYFLWPEDEKQAFERQVDRVVSTVNQGNYGVLVEYFSPDFKQWFESSFGNPLSMLFMWKQIDQAEVRSYRKVGVVVFHSKHYAEVRLERSEPEKVFNGKHVFHLPFSYKDGKWWLAKEFEPERPWDYRNMIE